MNAPLELLFAWLLDFSGLATALLVAAIVLRWLLRDPASRVALAWGTWLAIFAGGILLALPNWPRIDVAGWFAAPLGQPSVLLADEMAGSTYVYVSNELLAPVDLPLADSSPVSRVPALSPKALGARIGLLVAGLAIGWLAIGLVRAWRLIARSQPASPWTREELRQIVGPHRRSLPDLLTSKQIASALALGTLRPRIVLPLASATESNVPAVRAALAHEWAHIAAGDLWLLALERSLLPLLALHPLFWWLRRLTRLDQELAADAAAAGDKPAEYAEALLVWAKGEPHRRAGVAALAMWERPSNLSRRIHMILDPKRQSSASRRGWAAYAALALLFTLAVGVSLISWRPMSAQDQPQPQPTILLPAAITAKTLPAPPAEQPQIMIEMQLLSLDPATGEAAVTVIKAARPANVTDEGPAAGVVWADLNSADSKQLVQSVQAVRSTQVTAHPTLVTLNGQEATIEVGGEVPIVAVDETVNGERRERHIEFKGVGTRFRIKPQILAEDPRMLALEIVGEHSTLLPQQKDAADPTAVPVVKSQKIDLKATIELGKTLILLSDAPATRQVTSAPAAKEPAKNLLILLRPSLVEHKYVEVYPDPAAATRATAARSRYTRTRLTQAEADDEVKLAEQLRSIRQAVEELAREREATRQENAALRAELERLKQRWPQTPTRSTQNLPPVGRPLTPVIADTRVTLVFRFASAAEAADAAKALNIEGKLEKLGAAVMVSNTNVTVTGTEAAVDELSRSLSAKGELLTESKHGPIAMRSTPATAAAPTDPRAPNLPAAAARITRVYVFPGNKEAAAAVRSLVASWKAEGQEIAVDLQGNSLTVSGTEASLAKAESTLQAIGAGKLASQTRSTATEAVIAADPNTPTTTIQRGLEWLRAHQSDAQWTTEQAANGPSASQRRTYRKLLELDLQAAELELRAAQEDFEAAQQLSKRNAISAEELRMKRRAVDRTKIQVARLKVMLEAEEEQPETAPGAARPK